MERGRSTSSAQPWGGGGKGYLEVGPSAFQQAFSPRGSCPGSNMLTYLAPANSQYVWRAHDWNSIRNMISNKGGVMEKG